MKIGLFKKLFSTLILSIMLLSGMFFAYEGVSGMLKREITGSASSFDADEWDGNPVDKLENLVLNKDYQILDKTSFEIYSAKAFSYFASNPDAYNYNLMVDINLNNYEWTPISSFSKSFYGNNHTIYNMNISKDSSNIGLFGEVSGTVQNLVLENISINSVLSNDANIGGIAGTLSGNGTISYCRVSGNIEVNSGTNVKLESNCYVGGVVGKQTSTGQQTDSIFVCENKVNISVDFLNSSVGGIVGSITAGEISECANIGNILSNSNLGGIIGYAKGSDIKIDDCYNNGTLSMLNSPNSSDNRTFIGGIVGLAESTLSINHCYNSGDLVYKINPFIVKDNYPHPVVSGIASVGFAERISAEDAYIAPTIELTIKNSFNVGNIIHFVRENDDNVENEDNNEETLEDPSDKRYSPFIYTISNCKFGDKYTENNNYFDKDAEYEYNYLILDYLSGLEDAQLGIVENPAYINIPKYTNGAIGISNLSEISTTYGFLINDFFWKDKNNYWNKINGEDEEIWTCQSSYPILVHITQIGDPDSTSDPVTSLRGEGTQENPYKISTAAELAFMSNFYKENSFSWYELENDIDLSGRNWQPIGSQANTFQGNFNGNGHKIVGLNCSIALSQTDIGLFGYVQNAVIKDLIVEDFSYLTSGELYNTGTIAGRIDNSFIVNCWDNSNYYIEDIKSFNIVGSNNTIIYGDVIGTENVENALNLPDDATFNKGYLITIKGEGGSFYKRTNNKNVAYAGDFRIAFSSILNNLSVVSDDLYEDGKGSTKLTDFKDLVAKDSSFGYHLPTLLTNVLNDYQNTNDKDDSGYKSFVDFWTYTGYKMKGISRYSDSDPFTYKVESDGLSNEVKIHLNNFELNRGGIYSTNEVDAETNEEKLVYNNGYYLDPSKYIDVNKHSDSVVNEAVKISDKYLKIKIGYDQLMGDIKIFGTEARTIYATRTNEENNSITEYDTLLKVNECELFDLQKLDGIDDYKIKTIHNSEFEQIYVDGLPKLDWTSNLDDICYYDYSYYQCKSGSTADLYIEWEGETSIQSYNLTLEFYEFSKSTIISNIIDVNFFNISGASDINTSGSESTVYKVESKVNPGDVVTLNFIRKNGYYINVPELLYPIKDTINDETSYFDASVDDLKDYSNYENTYNYFGLYGATQFYAEETNNDGYLQEEFSLRIENFYQDATIRFVFQRVEYQVAMITDADSYIGLGIPDISTTEQKDGKPEIEGHYISLSPEGFELISNNNYTIGADKGNAIIQATELNSTNNKTYSSFEENVGYVYREGNYRIIYTSSTKKVTLSLYDSDKADANFIRDIATLEYFDDARGSEIKSSSSIDENTSTENRKKYSLLASAANDVDVTNSKRYSQYILTYHAGDEFSLICETVSTTLTIETPKINSINASKVDIEADGRVEIDASLRNWKYLLVFNDARCLNATETPYVVFEADISNTTFYIGFDKAFEIEEDSELSYTLPTAAVNAYAIEYDEFGNKVEDGTKQTVRDLKTNLKTTKRLSIETNQIVISISASSSNYYAFNINKNGKNKGIRIISEKYGEIDINSVKVECYYQSSLAGKTFADGEVSSEDAIYEETYGNLMDVVITINLPSDILSVDDIYTLEISTAKRLYPFNIDIVREEDVSNYLTYLNNPDQGNSSQYLFTNSALPMFDPDGQGYRKASGTNNKPIITYDDTISFKYDTTWGTEGNNDGALNFSYFNGLMRGYEFAGWYSVKYQEYFSTSSSQITYSMAQNFTTWGNHFLLVLKPKNVTMIFQNNSAMIENYNGQKGSYANINNNNVFQNNRTNTSATYTYTSSGEGTIPVSSGGTITNYTLSNIKDLVKYKYFETYSTIIAGKGYEFVGWSFVIDDYTIYVDRTALKIYKGRDLLINISYRLGDIVVDTTSVNVDGLISAGGIFDRSKYEGKYLIYNLSTLINEKGEGLLDTNIINYFLDSFLIDQLTSSSIMYVYPILKQAEVEVIVDWGIEGKEDGHYETYRANYYYGQLIDLNEFASYLDFVYETEVVNQLGYYYTHEEDGETKEDLISGTINLINEIYNVKGFNTYYWNYFTDKNNEVREALNSNFNIAISTIYATEEVKTIYISRVWKPIEYTVNLRLGYSDETYSGTSYFNILYGQSFSEGFRHSYNYDSDGNEILNMTGLQDWDFSVKRSGYSRLYHIEENCPNDDLENEEGYFIWQVTNFDAEEGEAEYVSKGSLFEYVRNIYVQAVWVENDYIITFDSNNGVLFDNNDNELTTFSMILTYNEAILPQASQYIKNLDNVQREGYNFVSWYLYGVDENRFGSVAEITDSTTYRSAVSNYLVSAVDEYTDDYKSSHPNFSITFDNGKDTSYSNGKKVYVLDASKFIFTTRWTYDTDLDIYKLNVTDGTLNIDYIGVEQELTLKDFVKQNEQGEIISLFETFGFSYDEILDDFVIETNDILKRFEDFNSNYQLILRDENGTSANAYITLLNAGTYSVTLEITIVDGAKYFNLGDIKVLSYTFNVVVNKASIVYADDADEDELGTTQLQVLKYYINLVGTEALKKASADWTDVSKFRSYFLSNETLKSFEVTDYYEFLFVKHYLMLFNSPDQTATTNAIYNQAKNMTFADYVNKYRNENAEMCKNIVKVGFYSIEFNDFAFENTGVLDANESKYGYYFAGNNNSVMSFKVEQDNFIGEIPLRAYRVSFIGSTTNGLTNSNFEVRVYVTSINSSSTFNDCENYDLRRDGTEYYLVAGNGTILPALMELEIKGNNQSYFSDAVHEIDWHTGYAEAQTNRAETYYVWNNSSYNGGKIYVYIRSIQTSNIGSADEDTKFTWDDLVNNFKITGITIIYDTTINASMPSYRDITSYFAIGFNNDTSIARKSVYTILSTKDIDSYTMTSMLLTRNSLGTQSFAKTEEIKIYVANVTININNETFVFSNSVQEGRDDYIGSDGSYYYNGAVCFQIEGYGTSECTIRYNAAVRSITFTIDKNMIGDYTYFYRFGSADEENITGLSELENYAPEYNYTLSNLRATGGTEKDLYAIFTDLLLAIYNYNLIDGEELTANSVTQTILQNGVSLENELNLNPERNGFNFKTYYIKGTKLDYKTRFTMIYTYGIQTLYLDAAWELQDLNISNMNQLFTVSTNEEMWGLDNNEVLTILNRNNLAINYTFEWLYSKTQTGVFESIYVGDKLQLSGTTDDSGFYKLRIITETQEESKTFTSDVFEISMQTIKITAVEWDEIDGTYTGSDYSNSTYATLTTYSYPFGEDKKNTFSRLLSITSGSIYFTISSNGVTVNSMKESGSYVVTLNFDNKIYSIESGVSITKNYTIEKYEVELGAPTLYKSFNTVDEELVFNYVFFGEEVAVSFTREEGEQIGFYDVYFKECTNQNFSFIKPRDPENPESEKIEVGYKFEDAFEIRPKNTDLEVVLDDTNLKDKNFTYDFNTSYTISLERLGDNYYYVRISYGSNVINLKLSFYDNSENAMETEISPTKINIISDLITLNNSNDVKNADTYAINISSVTCSEFSGVKFSNDATYNLIINPKVIGTDSISYVKDFDGEATAQLESSDVAVEDKPYVTITGRFSSIHAGTEYDVELSIVDTSNANGSNYILESEKVVKKGTINKIDADMTITVENDLKYGDVSINNFANYISYTITNPNKQNAVITPIENYFNLVFALSAGESDYSSNGLLQVGSYSVTLGSATWFSDFNVNIKSSDLMQVAQYVHNITLVNAYKIYFGEEIPKTINREEYISITGETINLVLSVVNPVYQIGTFDLNLVSYDNQRNYNVIVDGKDGFAIVTNNDTLFVGFDSTEGFDSNMYNGKTYEMNIKYSNDDYYLFIRNGGLAQSKIRVGFYIKSEDEEGNVTITETDKLLKTSKFDSDEGVTFFSSKNAGEYTLTLPTVEGTGFLNIGFIEEYKFTINKIEITLSSLMGAGNNEITVTYSGSEVFALTSSCVLSGDSVSINAVFDTPRAGTGKPVNLVINGEDRDNYFIDPNNISTTGTINKLQVKLIVNAMEESYGTFTTSTRIQYVLKNLTETETYTTNYVTGALEVLKPSNAPLTDEDYSALGYLKVGTYIIDNSNLEFSDFEVVSKTIGNLVIIPYNQVITFTNKSQFTKILGVADDGLSNISYLTSLGETVLISYSREPGEDMGNYHLIGATTTNPNYTFSVVDSSEGAFEIMPNNEILYILINDDDLINLEQTYNGANYSVVGFYQDEQTDEYYFKVVSQTNEYKVRVGSYTYDATTGEYNSILIEGFRLQFEIASNAKNAGTYALSMTPVQIGTFTNYRFGPYGSTSSYALTINKRILLLENISKVYDGSAYLTLNSDDLYTLSLGVEEENRFIASDSMEITFVFPDVHANLNDTPYNLGIYATSGTELGNYELSNYTGFITKDVIYVTPSVEKDTYIYGETINISYTTKDKDGIALSNAYLQQYVSGKLSFSSNEEDYSTGGYLKAGKRYTVINDETLDNALTFRDYRVIITDEIEVYIEKRTIDFVAKNVATLGDVFSKIYDGNNLANIYDDAGALVIEISSSMPNDIIYIENAYFETKDVGTGKKIIFEILGDDADNYTTGDYNFGVIESLTFRLNFNYNEDFVDGGTASGKVADTLTLSYPFKSANNVLANITANSEIAFPGSVSKVGYIFAGWTFEYGDVTYTLTNNVEGISNLRKALERMEEDNTLVGFTGFEVMANWEIEKFTVTINIADTNGKVDASRGDAKLYKVNGSNYEEIETTNNDGVITGLVDYYSYIMLEIIPENYTFASLTVDGVRVNNVVDNRYTKDGFVSADINMIAMFRDKTIKIYLDLDILSNTTMRVISSSIEFKIYNEVRNIYSSSISYATLLGKTLSSLPAVIASGYDFLGWSLDGSNLIEDLDYIEDDLLETLFRFVNNSETISDGDELMLYAMWQPHEYTLTIDANGGKFGDKEKIVIPILFNQTYENALIAAYQDGLISTTTPRKKGYVLDHFLYETVEIGLKEQYLFTKNVEISIIWEVGVYKVYLTGGHFDLTSTSSLILKDEETDRYYINASYGDIKEFTITVLDGYILNDIELWSFDEELVISKKEAGVNNSYITATLYMNVDEDTEIVVGVVPAMKVVTLNISNVTPIVKINGEETDIYSYDGYYTFYFPTDGVAEITLQPKTGYFFQTSNLPSCTNGFISDARIVGSDLIFTLSGVTEDSTVNVSVSPRNNLINLNYDSSKVRSWAVVSGGTKSNTASIKSETGSTLIIQMIFEKGYTLDKDTTRLQGFTDCLSFQESINEVGLSVVYITVTSFNIDTVLYIGHKLQSFGVEMVTKIYYSDLSIVYDAYCYGTINDSTLYNAEYNEKTQLYANIQEGYDFIGYYTSETPDNVYLISDDPNYIYTVTSDDKVYAIFMVKRYDVAISILEKYDVKNQGVTETRYRETQVASLRDEDGKLATIFDIYNRETKVINISVSEDYVYEGYVVYIDENGNYVVEDTFITASKNTKVIQILGNIDIKNQYYIIISAKTIEVNINTLLLYKGNEIYKDFTGCIEIMDENGYLESSPMYVSENTSSIVSDGNKNYISVSSILGHTLYLKVSEKTAGYYYEDITLSSFNTTNLIRSGTEDDGTVYYIFQILELGDGDNINIIFAAQENDITILYNNDKGNLAYGGKFAITDSKDGMAYISILSSSYIVVSALTDSYFDITASIYAGYNIFDEVNLINNFVYDGVLITDISLDVFDTRLTVLTGYSAVLRFKVSGYTDDAMITILLTPELYTVEFKDNSDTLVILENVAFGEKIDLSKDNIDNITILDMKYGLAFTEELDYLNMAVAKDSYRFGGYYTLQLAGGSRYIDANGEVIDTVVWNETGYMWNGSEYGFTTNATIDDDGHITIRLYIYWAFKKTGVTINMLPEKVENSLTVYNVISSNNLNADNSLWSSSKPLFLELGYETRVTFSAPKIKNYQYSYMIVSMLMSNGTRLDEEIVTDSYYIFRADDSYSVSELEITFVYKVAVNVEFFYGNATYTLVQDGETIYDGFIDYTKEFDIVLDIERGYKLQFVYYQNKGEYFYTTDVTLEGSVDPIYVVVYLKGEDVSFYIGEYNSARGKINMINVYSNNGNYSMTENQILQGMRVDLNVGDYLIFVTSIKYGYQLNWNDDRIKFVETIGDYHYYRLDIDSSFMDSICEITPIFTGQKITVDISVDLLDELINPVDDNNGLNAGKITRKGVEVSDFEMEFGEDLSVTVNTNERYAINKIEFTFHDGNDTLVLYGDNAVSLTGLYFLVDTLTVTVNALESYQIVGSVSIHVTYNRIYWQDKAAKDMFKGEGTRANPYVITCAEELALLSKLSNGGYKNLNDVAYSECNYILKSNISMNDAFFDPIGNEENPFNGGFNLDIYNIYDIYTYINYSESELHFGGLFRILGENANVEKNSSGIKILYIILGIVLFLILLIILIIIIVTMSRKRKLDKLSQNASNNSGKKELIKQEKELKSDDKHNSADY